jgi:PD-(D/E)XK endonuclease
MNPRQQGDLGEQSAIEYLWSQGYPVFVPFGHSPDIDLVALIDGRLVGVQVKTSRHVRDRRWEVSVCTHGGNQSWDGIKKRFDPDRCDWLFVLAGDGRRWFIPAHQVAGGTHIRLGGPTYAAYEVERGRPFVKLTAAPAG